MKTIKTILIAASTFSVITGCAVTELSPNALNVKMISEQQSKSCEFLQTISTNNKNTLSENPEQEARNLAFNRTAELGGNAFRVITSNTQASSSGVGSLHSITGEVYNCS